MTNEFRYYRWRVAINREEWLIDRHWYVMIGGLLAINNNKQNTKNIKE